MTGYMAHRFKSYTTHLGISTCQIPVIMNSNWIQFISRGKCTYPSQDMIAAARIVIIKFDRFHGMNFHKTLKIFN